MIILNNNNTNVNIPDYDDLVNKPSINGVVLEGNKTTAELGIDIDTTNFYTKREVNERIADSITGIESEFGNYYTKSQSDSKYQPKGNYLTSIPSEYITETELTNKGYATTTQLNSKQDTLVSGTNIKTINGISLLGDGNIVITGSGEGGSVDLSDYYTKGEVDGLISNLDTSVAENYYTIQEVDELVENVEPDLTGYATETYVSDNYQPKGNYLTSVPSEYITESELSGKNYATTSYVDTQIGNINTILENILN